MVCVTRKLMRKISSEVKYDRDQDIGEYTVRREKLTGLSARMLLAIIIIIMVIKSFAFSYSSANCHYSTSSGHISDDGYMFLNELLQARHIQENAADKAIHSRVVNLTFRFKYLLRFFIINLCCLMKFIYELKIFIYF
jgi:hypothetical protein